MISSFFGRIMNFSSKLKNNSLIYLGKVLICLITNSITVIYYDSIKTITKSFTEEHIPSFGDVKLTISIYVITNVVSLILSDSIICFLTSKDKDDKLKNLEREYINLEKKYKELQDKTKLSLNYFVSILKNRNIKTDEIIRKIDEFRTHIDDSDLEVIKIHCNDLSNHRTISSFLEELGKL